MPLPHLTFASGVPPLRSKNVIPNERGMHFERPRYCALRQSRGAREAWQDDIKAYEAEHRFNLQPTPSPHRSFTGEPQRYEYTRHRLLTPPHTRAWLCRRKLRKVHTVTSPTKRVKVAEKAYEDWMFNTVTGRYRTPELVGSCLGESLVLAARARESRNMRCEKRTT